jgi:hypothetical protein
MTIIKIEPYDNGAHANQSGNFATIPDGWIEIPSDTIIPDTFPFVNLTLDENNKFKSIEANQTTYDAAAAKAAEDAKNVQPTEQEKIQANVDYLAVMTGVELI